MTIHLSPLPDRSPDTPSTHATSTFSTSPNTTSTASSHTSLYRRLNHPVFTEELDYVPLAFPWIESAMTPIGPEDEKTPRARGGQNHMAKLKRTLSFLCCWRTTGTARGRETNCTGDEILRPRRTHFLDKRWEPTKGGTSSWSPTSTLAAVPVT